jgi:peroxiredoxin
MRKQSSRDMPRRQAILQWWPVFLAILLIIGLVVRYRMLPPRQVTLNKAAPSFTLPGLNGTGVSLRDLRGKVVFLNFWAGWCKYCVAEAAGLQTFAERYPTQVAIVGVNYKESEDAVRQFQQQFDISFPLLRDESGQVADSYLVYALPTTWVIDRRGIVRREWHGPASFEDLHQLYMEVTGTSLDKERAVGQAGERYQFVIRDGLYLLDEDKQWYSDNAGAAWTVVSRSVTPDLPGTTTSLGWSRQGALAWVYGLGLYRTTGMDTGWEPVFQSVFSNHIQVALAVAPNGAQAWAGTNQGLYVSADMGNTWEKLPVVRAINGIAVRPDQSELLLATNEGLWRCKPDGSQESLVPNSPVRRFDSVTVVQVGDEEKILTIAPNGDLYYTDGVGDWQLING